jgi:hypothetical protein
VLTPDLKVVPVSEAYLRATMTQREQILVIQKAAFGGRDLQSMLRFSSLEIRSGIELGEMMIESVVITPS